MKYFISKFRFMVLYSFYKNIKHNLKNNDLIGLSKKQVLSETIYFTTIMNATKTSLEFCIPQSINGAQKHTSILTYTKRTRERTSWRSSSTSIPYLSASKTFHFKMRKENTSTTNTLCHIENECHIFVLSHRWALPLNYIFYFSFLYYVLRFSQKNI